MAAGKTSFSDILARTKDEAERRMERKLPSWASISKSLKDKGLDPLELPEAISLEQCSSELSARHKAALASSLIREQGLQMPVRICDLTCGMGVDSWAFAQFADEVLAYERNPRLQSISEANLRKLGAENVRVLNEEITPASTIPACSLVYADPARRNEAGKKVFLLEDCSPDITALLPSLLGSAALVMLKLSPMADLSMLSSRLGRRLHQIHIISLKSEVKELLCILKREECPQPEIRVSELHPDGSHSDFSFFPDEERQTPAVFASRPEAGQILAEPRAAMMKSGAFRLSCRRFGIERLGASTQLYLVPEGGSLPPEAFFKLHRIERVEEFGNAAIRMLGREYPDAEVSARNLPLDSNALRKKLGTKGGGQTHIFGLSTSTERLLLVCRPS